MIRYDPPEHSSQEAAHNQGNSSLYLLVQLYQSRVSSTLLLSRSVTLMLHLWLLSTQVNETPASFSNHVAPPPIQSMNYPSCFSRIELCYSSSCSSLSSSTVATNWVLVLHNIIPIDDLELSIHLVSVRTFPMLVWNRNWHLFPMDLFLFNLFCQDLQNVNDHIYDDDIILSKVIKSRTASILHDSREEAVE